MTIAQAIREGVKKFPVQMVGTFYGPIDAACALGCASWSLGFGTAIDSFRREHASVFARPSECPECRQKGEVWDTAVHLNDDHAWPRERIAGWFDIVERGA